MILRKPYAILIKFFNIIHIALFGMFIYLTSKLKYIYEFFQGYVKNDVYIYLDNMASNYISTPMIIISIIIFFMAIAIFYLMRKKEKPVLFYRILIVYSLILLISIGVYYNFFVSLEEVLYERATLAIYRDIIGFIYYIAYFFVVFCFVRGFGFDIKKFRFDKDIKELHIEETDNEEFEVLLNIDKENIINAIRREKRLTGYYIKENAITLSIILAIFLIIGGIVVYRKFFVENVVHEQSEVVVANNLVYSITDVYLTNKGKTNEDLQTDYAVIKFLIKNPGDKITVFDIKKTRLLINDKYYYPILNRYDTFNDFGIGYNNQNLKPNVVNEYIMVFKLEKDISIDNGVVLQLYEGSANEGEKLVLNYLKMNLLVKKLNDKDIGTYKLNEQIDFNNVIYKESSIKFLNYDIKNNFLHKYQECVLDKCEEYTKVIQSNNNDILKLELESNNIDLNILENYASIEYILDTEKVINENDLKIRYLDDNTIFFETNSDLDEAKSIILKINMRGSIYRINILNDNLDNEKK